MKLKTTFITFVLPLLLSHSVQSKQLVDTTSFPDWLKDAMAKEASLEQHSLIEFEKLGLKFQVPGKVNQESTDEGFSYYTVDIGSGVPVECYIHSVFDGAANSLLAIMEAGIEVSEQVNNKKLSQKFNFALDSGVIGEVPYLAMDVMYHLGDDDQKLAGIVKGMSARNGDYLLTCTHNELGYHQTFKRIFESVVSGFKVPAQEPFYQAIYQFSFNGTPMGYARETYLLDADGDIVNVGDSGMLVAVDANSVMRTDSFGQEWSKPDGSLINAYEISVENSELASELSIQWQNDTWQVTGESHGKSVEYVLGHKETLSSSYATFLAAKSLNDQNPFETLQMWMSEVDASVASPVVISSIKDNPEANLKVDMGPLIFKYLADEQMILRQGGMQIGPVNIKMELLWSKGQPLLK